MRKPAFWSLRRWPRSCPLSATAGAQAGDNEKCYGIAKAGKERLPDGDPFLGRGHVGHRRRRPIS